MLNHEQRSTIYPELEVRPLDHVQSLRYIHLEIAFGRNEKILCSFKESRALQGLIQFQVSRIATLL